MKGIIYLLTQIVIQSEAKNLEYIKWVFPRSFLPSVVWMTPCGNLYIVPWKIHATPNFFAQTLDNRYTDVISLQCKVHEQNTNNSLITHT